MARIVPASRQLFSWLTELPSDSESFCNNSTNVSMETYRMFSNLAFISEGQMSKPIWSSKDSVI